MTTAILAERSGIGWFARWSQAVEIRQTIDGTLYRHTYPPQVHVILHVDTATEHDTAYLMYRLWCLDEEWTFFIDDLLRDHKLRIISLTNDPALKKMQVILVADNAIVPETPSLMGSWSLSPMDHKRIRPPKQQDLSKDTSHGQ